MQLVKLTNRTIKMVKKVITPSFTQESSPPPKKKNHVYGRRGSPYLYGRHTSVGFVIDNLCVAGTTRTHSWRVVGYKVHFDQLYNFYHIDQRYHFVTASSPCSLWTIFKFV